MTTIAWDGRFLAADSAGFAGQQRMLMHREKISVENGIAYAAFGVSGVREAWIKWYLNGAIPNCTPHHGHSDNDIGNFLVFKDGKCEMFSWMWPYAQVEIAPMAWGSGGEYAMGAMLAGASAEQAIEIAKRLNVYTDGPVQVIDLLSLKAEKPGSITVIHAPDDLGAVAAAIRSTTDE